MLIETKQCRCGKTIYNTNDRCDDCIFVAMKSLGIGPKYNPMDSSHRIARNGEVSTTIRQKKVGRSGNY